MSERCRWEGMLAIVRFNWPYYFAAAAVLVLSLAGACWLSALPLRQLSVACFLGAAWFVFGSLSVAHLIYDRSGLYRFGWLARALGGLQPRRCIFCHCGFDDASARLQEKLGAAEWVILDHYDPERMTEPSIQRARRLFPPTKDTVAAAFDVWPVEAASADAVFGLLAIHELRSEEERARWFGEAGRCLREGGRVVLVEHARDWANFAAFGPAFLHFHSPASWRRAWEQAGFRAIDEFRVTPWVRVFVVARS